MGLLEPLLEVNDEATSQPPKLIPEVGHEGLLKSLMALLDKRLTPMSDAISVLQAKMASVETAPFQGFADSGAASAAKLESLRRSKGEGTAAASPSERSLPSGAASAAKLESLRRSRGEGTVAAYNI